MALLKFMCVAYLILFSKGDECKNNQHCSDCNRSTGRCLTPCDPGYFDQMCRSACSKNCRNHSCQLSISGSGVCTDGCVPGYQGPGCNVGCDSPGGTCEACPCGCDGGYCQLASSCVSGCVDSYYGTDCKTCSSRCKSCNRMTGLCKECRPEYFGPNCAYSCDYCLGSCEHGCAEGCLPGLYGTFCEEKCSEKCGPYPASSTDKLLLSPKADLRVCLRASGDCIHGCREGWFGPQCSSPCSPNCANKRCKSTGDCVDGCVPGRFGRDCKPCPVNCLHSTCHSDSGKCTDGCTRGFYGRLCQNTCEVCVDGVCDQDCKQGDRDSGIVDLKIGLSTAFSLFVVIILLALSLFYCKHLRTIRQHNVQGIIPHDDQVLPHYCDILDEDVDIMCELPEMNQKESVQGTAPSMPVLAECFAPDCDSADNDVATSARSAVDDNTYSHLTPPVAVEGPKIVVNYVSPIED